LYVNKILFWSSLEGSESHALASVAESCASPKQPFASSITVVVAGLVVLVAPLPVVVDVVVALVVLVDVADVVVALVVLMDVPAPVPPDVLEGVVAGVVTVDDPAPDELVAEPPPLMIETGAVIPPPPLPPPDGGGDTGGVDGAAPTTPPCTVKNNRVFAPTTPNPVEAASPLETMPLRDWKRCTAASVARPK
jgi:hypothetical protein